MERQTTIASSLTANRKWYLVDASGKTLGRLATQVATILMGKDKPNYTPNADLGDYVIIINAAKVKMSGKEGGEHKKNYYNVSGYAGGLRTRSAGVMLREYPVELVERAVRGMIPHTALGRAMMRKCFVYADEKHGHEAQKPVALELK